MSLGLTKTFPFHSSVGPLGKWEINWVVKPHNSLWHSVTLLGSSCLCWLLGLFIFFPEFRGKKWEWKETWVEGNGVENYYLDDWSSASWWPWRYLTSKELHSPPPFNLLVAPLGSPGQTLALTGLVWPKGQEQNWKQEPEPGLPLGGNDITTFFLSCFVLIGLPNQIIFLNQIFGHSCRWCKSNSQSLSPQRLQLLCPDLTGSMNQALLWWIQLIFCHDVYQNISGNILAFYFCVGWDGLIFGSLSGGCF